LDGYSLLGGCFKTSMRLLSFTRKIQESGTKNEASPTYPATRLPAELWLHIFGFVEQSTTASATCVCKSWSRFLNQKLYTCVSIATFESSKKLLRTLNAHPGRGQLVRDLNLPLQTRRGSGSDSQRPQAKRFYLLYADIILLCPNLIHLNVPTYARELCFSLPLSFQHLPNLRSLRLRNARQRLTWKSCLLGQCLGKIDESGKPSLFSLPLNHLELEGYDIQTSYGEPNRITWKTAWSLTSLTLDSCDVSHEELIGLVRSCKRSLRRLSILFCCGLLAESLPTVFAMLAQTLHTLCIAGNRGFIHNVDAVKELQVLHSIAVDESVAQMEIFQTLPQSIKELKFTHLRPVGEGPSFMENTAKCLILFDATLMDQLEALDIAGQFRPDDRLAVENALGDLSRKVSFI